MRAGSFRSLAIGTVLAFERRMNQMRVRTDLRLAPPVSGGQRREDLIAFAMYCAARISRDLVGIDRWDLFVVGGLDGSADAVVRTYVGATLVEARSTACD